MPISTLCGASLLGKVTYSFETLRSPTRTPVIEIEGDTVTPPFIGGSDKSCLDRGGLLGKVEPGEDPFEFEKGEET